MLVVQRHRLCHLPKVIWDQQLEVPPISVPRAVVLAVASAGIRRCPDILWDKFNFPGQPCRPPP
jgi:hypothetical protein